MAAMALCGKPDLMILDEPTTGIDVQFLEKLSELIQVQIRTGMTCWITGNDPDWIAKIAGRVAFLDKGRILAQGSVKDLIREVSPFQRVEIVLAGAAEINLSPHFGGLHSLHRRGEVFTALLDDDPKLVPDLIHWIVSRGGAIKSLEVRKSTLRDAFLLKTGETL